MRSLGSPLLATPSWTASSTTPIASNSTGHRCAKSKPPKQTSQQRPPRQPPQPMPSPPREQRNEAQRQPPAAPVGQQAPPTHAATRLMGALRVVRGSLLLTTGTGSRRT